MPHGHAPLNSYSLAPRVWVLTGNRAGDNSQVLALAEGLGWPFEVKQFAYKAHEFVPNMLLRSTLAGIDKAQSSPVEAPWPDLVLSANRRNEPIARWIKQQAPDRVRIVHVGRPWSGYDCFDLIVTTPQYRLPERPNILHNKTPLHRVTRDRLAREATRWQQRLAHLPRPFVTVVVGGSSGPYSFDQRAAERLARDASAFAAARGGSLLITTSARTPLPTIETLAANVSVPCHLFRWSKDAAENPYFAFLGLADSLIVTGDSMSMLTEACATNKPVYIFDLGEGERAMRPSSADQARTAAAARGKEFERAHIKAFFYRLMMKLGPERLSRDIRIIHQYLTDTGRAVWLGDEFVAGRRLPTVDGLDRAVSRVRGLVEKARTQPSPNAIDGIEPLVSLSRFA